jgi:hypothetical protein
MSLLLVAWLLAYSTPARAEAPRRLCPDSTTFFEFQVGVAARWIADTTLTVHPLAATPSPPNLVQFVVDTAGVPVIRAFHALKVTDPDLVTEARRSLAQWRFTPAVLDGCNVRRLIQTPIGR